MPTFFFHSGMTGAPTNTNAAGSTLAIIRACLVNGFNVLTPSAASVTSEVMNITYSSNHGYENLVWIRLDGAAGGSIVKRATVTSPTTLTIEAPGFANGPVSGTLSTRVAPADWEEVFTGTLKAVFRSKVEGPGSTRFFYRISDAVGGGTPRIFRGFEFMTDVDTGVGPFPTVAQESGEGMSYVRDNGSGAARPWAVFCDGRTFYLCVSRFGSALVAGGCWFGDAQPINPVDQFCAAVASGVSGVFGASEIRYFARNFDATSPSISASGGGSPAQTTYPLSIAGGGIFSRPYLGRETGASTQPRYILRGILGSFTGAQSGTVPFSVMTADGISGRVALATFSQDGSAVGIAIDEDWS